MDFKNSLLDVDEDVKRGNLQDFDDTSIDFGKPWYKVRHLLRLNLLLLILVSAGSLWLFDGSLINSLQIMDHWNQAMGYPKGGKLGAITSGPPFGYLLALYPATLVSDKYGRKICMFVGAVITTAGTLIQGFANGYACFLASRIILGFGLSFYFVSAPAWIAELSFPKYRAEFVTLFNASGYIGSIVAAWSSFGSLGIPNSYQWRIPCFTQLAFTIPHMFCVWIIPESPRYLVSKNKEEQARKVLLEYHGGNDEINSGGFIDFQLKEIIVAMDLEARESQFSFISFFKSKANFHRFSICVFMGFLQYDIGLFSVAFYLSPVLEAMGIDSSRRQMLVASCITIFNLVCAYIPALLVGRFGRRKIFLVSLFFLFVVYVLFVVLSGINQSNNFSNPNLAKGIIGLIFMCYFFYDIGFLGMLLVYITEILPFARRSQGIMVYVISSQCFVIFNGFITPVAMDVISWKFYIVFAVSILCCGIFIYFFFPETKGYSLEETAWLFGDEVEDHQGITAVKNMNLDIVKSNDLNAVMSLSRERDAIESKMEA